MSLVMQLSAPPSTHTEHALSTSLGLFAAVPLHGTLSPPCLHNRIATIGAEKPPPPVPAPPASTRPPPLLPSSPPTSTSYLLALSPASNSPIPLFGSAHIPTQNQTLSNNLASLAPSPTLRISSSPPPAFPVIPHDVAEPERPLEKSIEPFQSQVTLASLLTVVSPNCQQDLDQPATNSALLQQSKILSTEADPLPQLIHPSTLPIAPAPLSATLPLPPASIANNNSTQTPLTADLPEPVHPSPCACAAPAAHLNPPNWPASKSLQPTPSSPPSSSPLLAPSDNYNIAAIGSITIVDDTIESPELQLAPEDSDEALQWDKECQEYYNDIQEELQQANADTTEIKKKKKKKKKKKASNPTATTDNPVLFYV
ncbi:hypothetical protein PCANC_06494 [Puccinia coronata f. sp. avenae]|uniref:Uncharacterized protein n=1 Tax=Puccinia coronata f. sp. avenae TaxID=200324 RepID=A0A2N5VVX9_9BASI|nr:hypothetical protein PCANC_06494 [Puccinia coronata f. sp. avenae]